jgi:hypothetical protein
VANGIVAVSNVVLRHKPFYVGSVSVYENGATVPTRRLKDPAATLGMAIALDGNRNCYWSFESSSGYGLDEFAHCKGQPIKVATGVRILGMTFDKQGNLYYTSDGKAVCRCEGVTMCGVFVDGLHQPVGLAFNRSESDLYVADVTAQVIYDIEVATGRIVGKIDIGGSRDNGPFWVAAAPAPRP